MRAFKRSRFQSITVLIATLVATSGLILVAPSPAAALGATTTDDSGWPNASIVGQNVQITAGVDATLPPGPVAPAFVSFFDGTSALGIAPLIPTFGCLPINICSKSYAQITVSSLSVGDHTINAIFLGDATGNLPSRSSYVQTVVAQAPPAPTKSVTVQLRSTPNPSDAGSAAAFTATVIPVVPSMTAPIGFVHLMDGGFPFGVPQRVNGFGQVLFTLTTLAPGTHSMTAVFEGDEVYLPGPVSNVVVQVIKPVVDLALAKDCPSGALIPGDTVSCTVSVSNGGRFDGEGIVVTDDLPPGLNVVGAPTGGGFTCTTAPSPGPEIRCTKPTQPPGTSVVTYSLRVSDDIRAASSLTNTAKLTSSTTDPTPGNNGASYTFLTVSCTIDRTAASSSQSIMGTPGNDVICGSDYADDINAGGGNDLVLGGGGSDHVSGGDGNDRLFGGIGDDQLAGGAGDDQLVGGDGNDAGAGGVGNDGCSTEVRLAGCES